jgi:hypothetical protein
VHAATISRIPPVRARNDNGGCSASPSASNGFLEAQAEELRASVSAGYSRGRFDVPRDRKDWYD